MSRKDRRRPPLRRVAAPTEVVTAVAPVRGRTPTSPARPVDRVTTALLPVRFFFGATFLYAGFDKLITPSFFDATSSASIQAQMTAFARVSPIGGLIRFGQPMAGPIGLLIALAEIGIGIGALTGLGFRLAAAGGAVLSLLFFLTVSWNTHPFYYGPDLPYAAGWIALAIAGHGGRFVPSSILAMDDSPASPTRRQVLQGGLLAVVSVVAASVAFPLRAGRASLGGTPTPSVPEITPTPAPTAPAGSIPVAKVADVERRGSLAFTVPFDAPAPLPAGDPGIIVKLANGTFVAFDAVCTHAGCTVAWDKRDSILLCPCHGAAFDAAHEAAVLDGPTDQPLTALPLFIDEATGRILLTV